MQISDLLKSTQELVKHNAPAILTGVAVAGTLSTAYLAATAGWKASKLIDHEELRLGHPITGPIRLSTKERAKIAWPLFIPAVGVGTMTIACVLGANHLQGQRAAALAGAYSLSEKAFSEYRAKVIERTSVVKEQQVRDSIAQDQIDRNPPTHSEIHILPNSDQTCYDSMTGRYFTTTSEKLRSAENTFNKTLLDNGYASLNDFYDLIGLRGTTAGEELGWTTDRLVELHVTTTMDDAQRPCLSLGFVHAPVPNYWKFR